jgi:hypothetical protein
MKNLVTSLAALSLSALVFIALSLYIQGENYQPKNTQNRAVYRQCELDPNYEEGHSIIIFTDKDSVFSWTDFPQKPTDNNSIHIAFYDKDNVRRTDVTVTVGLQRKTFDANEFVTLLGF